jgi:hypothetical protein
MGTMSRLPDIPPAADFWAADFFGFFASRLDFF